MRIADGESKEARAEKASAKNALEQCRSLVQSTMIAQNITKYTLPVGQAHFDTYPVYEYDDKRIIAYALQHGHMDLVTITINKSVVKEFIEADEKVPGVKKTEEERLVLSETKESDWSEL